MATPAPPPPATTTTTLEYEEDDSEGEKEEEEEEEERIRSGNDGGELGRGKFIGSADDGRIGQQTEGDSIRTVGEGKRSRDLPECHCDISILLEYYLPHFPHLFVKTNYNGQLNLILNLLFPAFFCHKRLNFSHH